MPPQSPNQLPNYPITQVPDSRPPQAIGREARLELVFERRRERTILAHAYAEPPFRVGRAFDLDGAAYLIIVCSGPGIFAGDTLRQSVRVGRGARVVLTSQSALQVHPSAAPAPATVHHQYHVEDDGELRCEWDPVIPFAGARLAQRFDLEIAASGRLYWTDALMSGRVSRGEAWRFQSLAHELRVQVGPSLAYLERYRLAPADAAEETSRIDHPWIAAGMNYLATAIVYHEAASADAAETLQRQIGSMAGVRVGVDLVQPRTIAARLMAGGGAPFAAARASYHALALATIFGTPGRVGRK
jgi:urease accessory protein UreH